ncbi:hypothetical protein ACTXT7_009971 [Hymenolepis weldensis]
MRARGDEMGAYEQTNDKRVSEICPGVNCHDDDMEASSSRWCVELTCEWCTIDTGPPGIPPSCWLLPGECI